MTGCFLTLRCQYLSKGGMHCCTVWQMPYLALFNVSVTTPLFHGVKHSIHLGGNWTPLKGISLPTLNLLVKLLVVYHLEVWFCRLHISAPFFKPTNFIWNPKLFETYWTFGNWLLWSKCYFAKDYIIFNIIGI